MKIWAIALAVVAAAATPGRADDLLRVAIGGRGSMESSPAELGQKAGFFARHGVRLDVIYSAGSGESMQAVISGSMDVGIGVGAASTIGAFAKGAPVRAIGAAITGADDLFWYVRADSPIRSIRDTAGKTVAYSTAGSSTQTVVLGFKDHFGVELRPVAAGAPPAVFTQVMSGQIDVGWSSGPGFLQDVQDGRIRIIAHGGDVPWLRGQSPRLLVANADALAARRDAFVRFMRGYRETVNWLYTDPSAMKAFAAWIPAPEAIAIKARDEIYDNRAIDPDRIIGVEGLMAEAVRLRMAPAPLSEAQLRELFQAPLMK